MKKQIHEYSVYFLIPLACILLLRCFGFDGLYGQDAYEYLRYTNAIKTAVVEGTHPGTFFWPVLYSVVSAFFSFLFGNTGFALQFVSAISISATCVYLLKTLKLLFPQNKFAFYYVLIFGLFAPFVLKMGLIAMSDALALAFVTLTFYSFIKHYRKNTSLAMVFIFSVCAFTTRYPSIVAVLPIVLMSTFRILIKQKFNDLVFAFLGSVAALLPFLILKWDSLFEASSNYFLQQWHVKHFITNQFVTADGSTSYLLPNGLFALSVFFHPGFIFLGSLLSVLTLKNIKSTFNFETKVLLISITIYVLFLAGIPFQNPRILGLIFPFVLIVLFPAFENILKIKLIKKYLKLLLVLSLITQLIFFSLTFKHIYKRTIVEKQLSIMLLQYQKNTLYSFDVDLALQGRGLDFNYENMFTKIYDSPKIGSLILFDKSRYATQWKDKNPMLNWNFMSNNFNLKIIETHTEGWKLYKIISKK